VIVVDASVLVPALADDGDDGTSARARLGGQALVAPELVDLEAISVIRRLLRAHRVTPERAAQALSDLADLPIERVGHRPLIGRCWELRENLTPYDAAYVVVAEILHARLVTADARLATAPGLRCEVELLA
jgi:predicted nucleic acid-binding protein